MYSSKFIEQIKKLKSHPHVYIWRCMYINIPYCVGIYMLYISLTNHDVGVLRLGRETKHLRSFLKLLKIPPLNKKEHSEG